MRQLTKLCHPFPRRMVEQNPKGGDYVSHPVVEQRLLDVVGPVSTEVVQVVRGNVGQGQEKKALTDVVVGVVLRMTAEVDGRSVTVEEVGDCESPGFWPTDGARLKDAMSDAYKRCAMRLGVGLHLWAQEHFYLAEKLAKQDGVEKKDGFPLSRSQARSQLEAIFAKGGSSVPAEEAEDLLRAMNAPEELTQREWAALANAADDIVKAMAA